MKQLVRNQQGTSLMELIVALVLLGIFLSMATATILKNSRWMSRTLQDALWMNEGHRTFRILQKDFFHIQKSNIVYFHPRLIILKKSNQWIIYILQRNTLYRNWQPILKYLKEQPIFYLLNEDNDVITTLASTRFIEVRLQAEAVQKQWRERFYVEN